MNHACKLGQFRPRQHSINERHLVLVVLCEESSNRSRNKPSSSTSQKRSQQIRRQGRVSTPPQEQRQKFIDLIQQPEEDDDSQFLDNSDNLTEEEQVQAQLEEEYGPLARPRPVAPSPSSTTTNNNKNNNTMIDGQPLVNRNETLVEGDYSIPDGNIDGGEREDHEEQASNERKKEALFAMLQAGDAIESKIEEYLEDIDEEMLEILEQRIIHLENVGIDEPAMQGLLLLHRRLEVEIDRKNATPAMKLLDDIMSILAEADIININDGSNTDTTASIMTSTPESRAAAEEAAAERLRVGFGKTTSLLDTFGPGDDVLTLAAKLARQGPDALEAMGGAGGGAVRDGEEVDPMELLGEGTELLGFAKEGQQQIETYLKEAKDENEKRELESALAYRIEALDRLERALGIARRVQREMRLG
jgi:hypothetical protein